MFWFIWTFINSAMDHKLIVKKKQYLIYISIMLSCILYGILGQGEDNL